MTRRYFDAYVALPAAEGEATPDPSVAKLFNAGSSAYAAGGSLAELIEAYDRVGVVAGLLTKVPRDITPAFVPAMRMDESLLRKTCEQLVAAAQAHPGRFVLSVGLDPSLGYDAARHVRIAANDYGIRNIRILPMFTGVAIDDRLAYPLYTAACDVGASVAINVGVPGTMKPARLQRTILIDEVALCFPDLQLVMSHVGDPWVDETIAMLAKHPNVSLMTAGFAPKHLPEKLVSFMDSSRGRAKVMWASYFPLLGVDRCAAEAEGLGLRPESFSAYAYDNAARIFGPPIG